MSKGIFFANPLYLWWLLLIPLAGWWYWQRHRQHYAPIQMSSLAAFGLRSSWRGRARAGLPFFRAISFACLVIALARPQRENRTDDTNTEGIDIVLAMDVSPSMLSQDFNPNRLEVAKTVASDFVRRRRFDRIGLVIFSGEAFTQCPSTTDHNVLLEQLDALNVGILEEGTAIGMGLATAVNRIQSSNSKSKIIILMTDGKNNRGYFSPEQAMELAKTLGVKVYTIGIGTNGEAMTPTEIRDGKYIFTLQPVEIDEVLLQKIADQTHGLYYRATTSSDLDRIYGQIDQLEKSYIEANAFHRRTEAYGGWLLIGATFILLELLLRYTIFRTIP